MKNGEKTNIEEMTKQSVYSVQCEKEISEENNDEKAKQSCIILDKLVLVPCREAKNKTQLMKFLQLQQANCHDGRI